HGVRGIKLGFLFEETDGESWRNSRPALKVLIDARKNPQQRALAGSIQTNDADLRPVKVRKIDVFKDSFLVEVPAYPDHGVNHFVWNSTHQKGKLSGLKTCQRLFLGRVHVEHAMQFCELKQVRNLPAGIAELQLSPRFSLFTFALWTRIPIAVVVLKDRRATRRTDRLRNGAQRHDQFAQPAAIDVRNIFEIEQDFVVS